MVFSAGFGTRMGALTADRPKPLVPVGGRALIDHALDLCAGLRVVVNTHYLAGQIAAHLSGRDVAISHEAGEILETGGGLRAALPLLGPGSVFTLNSDAIWQGPNPLAVLRAAWAPQDMSALLLLAPLERTHGRQGPPKGDFTLGPDGRLTRGGNLLYLGAQIVVPEGLDQFPPVFSLNALWDGLMAKGRLFGTVYPGQWCDVGHPGGIAQAEALLNAGQP
jgi:N-acetyl-alpha-D-muramate 1-phosphate uridylyltransferase